MARAAKDSGRERAVTVDLHSPDGAGSTRHVLAELIEGSGARPVASTDDLERFRTDIWESEEEVEAFIADLRASRNAGI